MARWRKIDVFAYVCHRHVRLLRRELSGSRCSGGRFEPIPPSFEERAGNLRHMLNNRNGIHLQSFIPNLGDTWSPWFCNGNEGSRSSGPIDRGLTQVSTSILRQMKSEEPS